MVKAIKQLRRTNKNSIKSENKKLRYYHLGDSDHELDGWGFTNHQISHNEFPHAPTQE